MKLVTSTVVSMSLLVVSLFAAEPSASLADLAWLSGSWKMEASGRLIEEHWSTPVGGAMLATSRTIKNGQMIEFEFLRIEQRESSLVYVAQPQGNPPTEFRLASSTANELVFANPQHDFPQRIRYRRNQDGSVTARVEDASGKKGYDFHYVKSPCGE